jgi:uncharacterized membrane protein YagU involved in acid resistance
MTEAVLVVLAGIAAGVVATWIMTRVTTFMYERENRAAREREDAARGNKTAYEVAAEKGAGLFGKTLTEKQRNRWGLVVHWSLGIGAGILYAAIRTQLESPDLRHGLLFGFVFWLVMDEGMTPLLRLTPGPFAFPWQTHARGLVGHLVFGAVAELTLSLLGMVGYGG